MFVSVLFVAVADLENTYHLHSAENGNRVALLNLAAVVDTDLNQDTRHRRADLAAVCGVGLGPRHVLDSSVLVLNSDGTGLSVHLVEDLTQTGLLGQRTDSKELKDQHLTLLELDVELLADLRTRQEVACGQDGQIAVLCSELLVVLEDLGVHDGGCNVALSSITPLGLEVGLDLGNVNGVEVQARALVHLPAVTEGLRAERLGETAVGLTHQTLEELQHRGWEVELVSLAQHIVVGELVGNHELGQVTDNLGGRCDLDDVTEQVVGLLVRLLGLCPLLTETLLRGLEDKVGELTTGNLVLVDLGVGAGKTSLEWRVCETELSPVCVQSADSMGIETRVEVGALKRSEDSTNAGLRSHTRHAVNSSIDSVGASLSTGNHGGHTSTSGVVGVDVDGEIRVLLTDGTNEEAGSARLQNTSHILYTQHVNAHVDQLLNNVEVVLEVVLLLGVEHVAARGSQYL